MSYPTKMTIEEAWSRVRGKLEEHLNDLQHESSDFEERLAYATLSGTWLHGTAWEVPFEGWEYDVEEIPLGQAEERGLIESAAKAQVGQDQAERDRELGEIA